MASPAAGTRRNGSAFAPFEEARRLFKLANELETLHHKDLFPDALKAFVAFVDAHQKELRDRGNEIAPDLDRSAMAFFRMSQAVPALRAIDLGLTLAPDVPSLLHHKAVVLLSQSGSPEPALALVDRAIELRPHDKAIWATKGEVLRALNRTDEAADAYLRAQQLDATSMQYVERALKLTPNNPVALRMKLRLAKAHGGDSQALEACDALLKVSPNDPELLLARAELLRSLGQLGPALETLERARLLKPGDPGLTFQQGRILLRLGRENEAAERFESLLAQKAPLDANALHEIADAAEARGTNLTLAVSARQRLHELEPRNLENLGALRSLSVRTRNPDLGIAACRAVIEISPQNLEAMRGLAEFLLSADRVEEGFEEFRALIQAHPNAIHDMRRALEAAKHLDQPPMVKEFAQAILRENPHDAGALDELAHAQMGAGERPEALKILDNLIRERPNDIGPLIEKKQLLVDLGQLEDLPKVYDDLFRLDPTRSDIALERGELYLQRALNQAHGDADR
jgi:tetratricopeptide (TPR) repeat protein